MIGMNMNTNSISLEQYIARANNTFPGKFYVIKSINESNILNSIRFKIWCSTIKGNQKLQKAFKEADKKYPIFLFFSVNGSGKFMGIALMNSDVENKVNFNYWSQNDKWKGVGISIFAPKEMQELPFEQQRKEFQQTISNYILNKKYL